MKSSQPVQVLILVPTLGRDLRGHALVGYHLTRRNVGVSYASLGEVKDLFRRLRPSVLVLDSMSRQSNFELAAEARETGSRIAILSTAGFFQSEDCEVEWVGGARQAGALVDRFFAWGSKGAELLVRRGILEAPQITVTGSPRFDLYSPAFQRLAKSRAALLQPLGFPEPSAPLVVWATNTWFSRAGQLGREMPSHLLRDIEDERLQFEHLSGLLEPVWKKHPEWNFIIKVHPAEQAPPYEQLAAGRSNVRVSRDLPIDELLPHCVALVQRCSTTATEAWMCGKPVIEPGLGGYHYPAKEEYSRGNDHATSSDELAALLQGYVAGRAISAEQSAHRRAFLGENFGKLDGMASERIALELRSLLGAFRGDASRPVGRHPREGMRTVGRRLRHGMRERVRHWMGLPPGASLLPWRRSKGTTGAGLWEFQVGPELVNSLYQGYASVLQNPEALDTPASVSS